ncbi:MAG: TetR/AcrR family transcriptional regulator [bacterium]|nr:TetR/AcrR family transcriptional regulator [bacterium]
MSPKVVDRQEKKEQILQAALQVFRKNGFAGATISDIATAAGIGKGTVYEYFSTKDEIINQSFSFFVRSFTAGFQAVLELELPAKERLLLIMGGFSEILETDSMELVELMFDFWSESIREHEPKGFIFKEMRLFYETYRGIFVDLILAGMTEGDFTKNINPRSVASMLIGMLDGLLVQWVLDKESVDYRDIINTAVTVLLDGISAKSESE